MKTGCRIVALLALAGLPGVALAVDLSNNLSQATAGTETATGTKFLAASFTATTASTIGTVTLLLGNPSAGQATVSIYSSAGMEPASLVGTMNSPGSYTTSLSQTSFTSPGISLAAGSTYWVVLSATSGSFDWGWAADASGTGTGFTHVWDVSEDTGAFWWSFDTYPLQMSVSTGVTCYANCDGSTVAPTLNANDFQCFLNSFAANSAYANCDGSTVAPILNANDFQCFLNQFAAGCS